MAGFLGTFLLTQYHDALRGPFLADDYYFLAKTRSAAFASLWLPRALEFGYWRPFSREFHFWALTHAFGPRELPFHIASMLLATVVGALYFLLVRRLAGVGAAATATAGAFGLAAWGILLRWPSGSQDLWMLVFALATLLCVLDGRRVPALFAFALALLSKELAVVVPGIALAHGLVVGRLRVRQALARTAGLWALVVGWVVLHPMLGVRIFHAARVATNPDLRVPVSRIVLGTLLAVVNLDAWPRPEHGWSPTLGQGSLAAALLCAAIVLATGPLGWRSRGGGSALPSARIAAFGVIWALIAWSPLFVPLLGWHPYYGMLGMLGAWCAIAVPLARRPMLAAGVVATLAMLRAGRAVTPSQDWSSEWFQRQAAAFGTETREYFRSGYPSLPSHSRIFLGKLPGRLGMVPGVETSFAFQMWYGDTTLHTYFRSSYRPRAAGQVEGRDYLFVYEPGAGWREQRITALPEHPTPAERETYAEFVEEAGNLDEARAQYEQLVKLEPQRWDHAYNLGSCMIMLGDSTAGARWYERAAALPGAPPEVRHAAALGRAFLPP